MSDEIDEFIRRAAERRKSQGQRQPQRAPQQRLPPPPPAARPRLARPEVVEAEIVSADVTDATQEFAERASHLGEEAALADDKLEARLHKTFDHQLGSLAQKPSGEGPPAAATLRTATDTAAVVTSLAMSSTLAPLMAALRSPQYIRQAIILSEILNRPVDRW